MESLASKSWKRFERESEFIFAIDYLDDQKVKEYEGKIELYEKEISEYRVLIKNQGHGIKEESILKAIEQLSLIILSKVASETKKKKRQIWL